MSIIIQTTALLVVVMFIVAMITYIERKILAALQLRKGPSIVGPFGVLQPLADCIKLLCKQIIWPEETSKLLFCVPTFISITFTLLIILFIPFPIFGAIINCDYSIIFIAALSMIASLGECLPGVILKSQYAIYGARRAIIQVMSYELCLVLCLLNIGVLSDGFDFQCIMKSQSNIWNIVPLCHVFIIFLAVAFAESNRTPFDTLEAEQELIAGYHTEYSGVLFCVFYITEYTNIFVSSLLISIMFLGGWENDLYGIVQCICKTMFIVCFIIITRAVLPRYRFYDIIVLFWKHCIPILVISAYALYFVKEYV